MLLAACLPGGREHLGELSAGFFGQLLGRGQRPEGWRWPGGAGSEVGGHGTAENPVAALFCAFSCFFFSSVDSLCDRKAAVWAEFIDYSPTKVGRWQNGAVVPLMLVFLESASGHLCLGVPDTREQKASAFKGDQPHGALVGFLRDPFRILLGSWL